MGLEEVLGHLISYGRLLEAPTQLCKQLGGKAMENRPHEVEPKKIRK